MNAVGDISMSVAGTGGCIPGAGCCTDGVPGGSVAGVTCGCSSAAGPGVCGFMLCRTMFSIVDCSGVLLNRD